MFRLVVLLLIAGAHARTGIVHLFEWRFDDIADECERFLGPYGYEAVQVSPVNECYKDVNDDRPWWERYQPYSYRIVSRSGNETEFKEMCSRCNAVGVKIYVDVVINHMSGDNPSGSVGTAGSEPDTSDKYYPDVPFTSDNFHATCSVSDYDNATNVRDCELEGLHDIDGSQEAVRAIQVAFLNKLVELGASGFRVDAAKHMWPTDLRNIMSRVSNVSTGGRPFIYQEVNDPGTEAVHYYEYTDIGRVTEFKYGSDLSNCFKGNNALKWLRNWGEPWSLMPNESALVFIDNHDTQRSDSSILTYKDARPYKMAVGFMLAWPYGAPRVMSSYSFSSSDQGPPHYSNMSIEHVTVNSDLTCNGGWICEHRWRQIYSMVNFANVVRGTNVTQFTYYGDNQISFCRGNKGFVVFNLESTDLTTSAKTCLPAGTYCDVVSGLKDGDSCTGKSVTVGSDGTASISLKSTESDGFLAIHEGSKLGSTDASDIIAKYDESYKDFRTYLCNALNASC